MDIDSNEIVLRGLSMPHSPRWYNGKLWVLKSGEGTLATVDPENGTWQTVAEVPGFTRGIDFIGSLAFIGLSKVRESATFSGIAIVSRLKERTCGAWVSNIETGATVAFLRFEAGFLPLLETPGFDFYSLQKGPQREELSTISTSIALHDLNEKLNDYGDLVVILKQLDLIITVDTSVAHLAGAVGTPVWVLLSALPDWRWGLESDTTPWYPGMRLARQNKLDDWSNPITQARKALQNLSPRAP